MKGSPMPRNTKQELLTRTSRRAIMQQGDPNAMPEEGSGEGSELFSKRPAIDFPSSVIDGTGRRAATKSCSLCLSDADFSLTLLLSTVGVTPRYQKGTHCVLLCKSCLQNFIGGSGPSPLPALSAALGSAHTWIEERLCLVNGLNAPASQESSR